MIENIVRHWQTISMIILFVSTVFLLFLILRSKKKDQSPNHKEIRKKEENKKANGNSTDYIRVKQLVLLDWVITILAALLIICLTRRWAPVIIGGIILIPFLGRIFLVKLSEWMSAGGKNIYFFWGIKRWRAFSVSPNPKIEILSKVFYNGPKELKSGSCGPIQWWLRQWKSTGLFWIGLPPNRVSRQPAVNPEGEIKRLVIEVGGQHIEVFGVEEWKEKYRGFIKPKQDVHKPYTATTKDGVVMVVHAQIYWEHIGFPFCARIWLNGTDNYADMPDKFFPSVFKAICRLFTWEELMQENLLVDALKHLCSQDAADKLSKLAKEYGLAYLTILTNREDINESNFQKICKECGIKWWEIDGLQLIEEGIKVKDENGKEKIIKPALKIEDIIKEEWEKENGIDETKMKKEEIERIEKIKPMAKKLLKLSMGIGAMYYQLEVHVAVPADKTYLILAQKRNEAKLEAQALIIKAEGWSKAKREKSKAIRAALEKIYGKDNITPVIIEKHQRNENIVRFAEGKGRATLVLTERGEGIKVATEVHTPVDNPVGEEEFKKEAEKPASVPKGAVGGAKKEKPEEEPEEEKSEE